MNLYGNPVEDLFFNPEKHSTRTWWTVTEKDKIDGAKRYKESQKVFGEQGDGWAAKLGSHCETSVANRYNLNLEKVEKAGFDFKNSKGKKFNIKFTSSFKDTLYDEQKLHVLRGHGNEPQTMLLNRLATMNTDYLLLCTGPTENSIPTKLCIAGVISRDNAFRLASYRAEGEPTFSGQGRLYTSIAYVTYKQISEATLGMLY